MDVYQNGYEIVEGKIRDLQDACYLVCAAGHHRFIKKHLQENTTQFLMTMSCFLLFHLLKTSFHIRSCDTTIKTPPMIEISVKSSAERNGARKPAPRQIAPCHTGKFASSQLGQGLSTAILLFCIGTLSRFHITNIIANMVIGATKRWISFRSVQPNLSVSPSKNVEVNCIPALEPLNDRIEENVSVLASNAGMKLERQYIRSQSIAEETRSPDAYNRCIYFLRCLKQLFLPLCFLRCINLHKPVLKQMSPATNGCLILNCRLSDFPAVGGRCPLCL